MVANDDFEMTARRIRRWAQQILDRIPPDDPDVIWARRAALLGERHGTPPGRVPRFLVRGVWHWPDNPPRRTPEPPTDAEQPPPPPECPPPPPLGA